MKKKIALVGIAVCMFCMVGCSEKTTEVLPTATVNTTNNETVSTDINAISSTLHSFNYVMKKSENTGESEYVLVNEEDGIVYDGESIKMKLEYTLSYDDTEGNYLSDNVDVQICALLDGQPLELTVDGNKNKIIKENIVLGEKNTIEYEVDFGSVNISNGEFRICIAPNLEGTSVYKTLLNYAACSVSSKVNATNTTSNAKNTKDIELMTLETLFTKFGNECLMENTTSNENILVDNNGEYYLVSNVCIGMNYICIIADGEFVKCFDGSETCVYNVTEEELDKDAKFEDDEVKNKFLVKKIDKSFIDGKKEVYAISVMDEETYYCERTPFYNF